MTGVSVDYVLKRWWATVPEATRDAIDAAIPPNMHIRIYAGHQAQPGTGTVSLRTADNHAVAEERGRDLAALCWYVIRQAPEALRVTTNVDGWVTDIEDVT